MMIYLGTAYCQQYIGHLNSKGPLSHTQLYFVAVEGNMALSEKGNPINNAKRCKNIHDKHTLWEEG